MPYKNPEDRRAYLRRYKKQHGGDSFAKKREYERRRLYGMEPSDMDRMLREQGNACAICRLPMKAACVDHCHDTGKVRGLLCSECNLGLGKFKDSRLLLEQAISYLQRG